MKKSIKKFVCIFFMLCIADAGIIGVLEQAEKSALSYTGIQEAERAL